MPPLARENRYHHRPLLSAAQVLQPADAALVRCARGGDRASFGRLYERYRSMVHGILLAYVPYGDAEDLMQEAFLRAMENLPRLREDAAFGPWLASIARHLALDHIRRRRPSVEVDESNRGSSRLDHSAAVLDAIRRLPEAYRETLLLRLVEGMTGPEIASRTGLRADSVRVNLCRGMKLLREQLGSARHE